MKCVKHTLRQAVPAARQYAHKMPFRICQRQRWDQNHKKSHRDSVKSPHPRKNRIGGKGIAGLGVNTRTKIIPCRHKIIGVQRADGDGHFALVKRIGSDCNILILSQSRRRGERSFMVIIALILKAASFWLMKCPGLSPKERPAPSGIPVSGKNRPRKESL